MAADPPETALTPSVADSNWAWLTTGMLGLLVDSMPYARRMHAAIDQHPTPEDAAVIVAAWSGSEVISVARFPTGLANYVYDVALADGRRLVARLQQPGAGARFAGAVHWNRTLRPRGVPLPELYAHDLAPEGDGVPFMLLERLPGQDLQHVYRKLTLDQKRRLAERIVAIQRAVGELPRGRGFGYGASCDDPDLLPTWRDVLLTSLARSRARIAAAGVVSSDWVDRVAERLPALDGYLARVEPIPFLDDTTTKNVLIHEGALAGIVDVDWICFGDPLFTVALTRMALLAHRLDPDYIDAWIAELAPSPEQRAALSLYTALFCVDFMSELGSQFNQPGAVPANPKSVRQLEDAIRLFLAEFDDR